MSGHSKWSQIKRKKGVADQKRGQLFSKLTKMITLTAKSGPNPETNFQLRLAVDKAKSQNLPAENISRAIEKATDTGDGDELQELVYEAYGPEGTALIIKIATDNKNRTSSEIKKILNDHSGRIAESGGVKWMFEERGAIVLPATKDQTRQEEIELAAIDLGASDIKKEDRGLVVYTLSKELRAVKEGLEKQGTKAEEAKIELVTRNSINPSGGIKKRAENLMEALEEHEDVSEIYSNMSKQL